MKHAENVVDVSRPEEQFYLNRCKKRQNCQKLIIPVWYADTMAHLSICTSSWHCPQWSTTVTMNRRPNGFRCCWTGKWLPLMCKPRWAMVRKGPFLFDILAAFRHKFARIGNNGHLWLMTRMWGHLNSNIFPMLSGASIPWKVFGQSHERSKEKAHWDE